MALEGISAHPDDVVVTVGSQQAVDLVTRIFCDLGDVVIREAPSYVGRSASSRPSSARSCTPRWTPTARPRRAAAGDRGHRAAGKTIKFLYTIPNFHNPAGVTMSLARRRDPRHL